METHIDAWLRPHFFVDASQCVVAAKLSGQKGFVLSSHGPGVSANADACAYVCGMRMVVVAVVVVWLMRDGKATDRRHPRLHVTRCVVAVLADVRRSRFGLRKRAPGGFRQPYIRVGPTGASSVPFGVAGLRSGLRTEHRHRRCRNRNPWRVVLACAAVDVTAHRGGEKCCATLRIYVRKYTAR